MTALNNHTYSTRMNSHISLKGPQHPNLSETVLSLVIEQAVEHWRLIDCLRLRLVSHHFDQEILRQLYTLFRINRKIGSSCEASCTDELVATRYWEAFVGNHSPDRSYKEMKYFPDPDIDRCSQHVHKQKRRLRRIHTTLREAVETMVSLVKANKLNLCNQGVSLDQGNVAEASLNQACVKVLSQAATSLLGPEFAWSFVHFQQKPHVYWVLYRSGRDSHIESFYEKHLLAKPVKFWITLVAAYVGDTELLREHLDSISIKHRDPAKWMERLNMSYYVFSSKSSAVERRWLEVLSACLTVAINNVNLDLVNFVLEQDPAVFMLAFHSITFNEYNLLDLAVRSHSVSIMTALLNHSWLINPNGKISDTLQYEKTIVATAQLSQDIPDRDSMMLRLLSLSNQWQTVPRLQKILNHAIRRDDVQLIEILLSTMAAQPGPSDSSATDYSRKSAPSPLQTAIAADHVEMVHLLLSNSSALRLPKMTSQRPPHHDFRTEALLDLLRRGTTTPLNITILSALLSHSTDIHDRQVEALVSDPAGLDLLSVFTRHVDLTAVVSSVTGHQVGEVALATAAANQDLRVLRHLLEECGFAVRTPPVPAPAPWRAAPWHNARHRRLVRGLLARHRLAFDFKLRVLRAFDEGDASRDGSEGPSDDAADES